MSSKYPDYLSDRHSGIQTNKQNLSNTMIKFACTFLADEMQLLDDDRRLVQPRLVHEDRRQRGLSVQELVKVFDEAQGLDSPGTGSVDTF